LLRANPVDELGASISALLLAPFACVIDESTHMLIVPFGIAHLLPFHALPYAGRPLGEGRTVAYLPSASSLPFLRPGPLAHRERALAVGNPANMVFRPEDGGPELTLAPLQAAEAAAALVAGLFPQGLALLGSRTTEAEVRAHLRDDPIVHLATHGYLSEEAPLLSCVLVADGGRLTARDLLGLRLDADVVVLSACEPPSRRCARGASTCASSRTSASRSRYTGRGKSSPGRACSMMRKCCA
jgi:CHAT domain-containing protein